MNYLAMPCLHVLYGRDTKTAELAVLVFVRRSVLSVFLTYVLKAVEVRSISYMYPALYL